MATFNASVSEESRTENGNRAHNQTGQCDLMLNPALGSLTLVSGNGTSVGTVMTLQCPSRHRLVGGEVACIWSSNSTQWSGIPECKPLYEDFGFRVAVICSIVSSAVILVMSMAFITSCLLNCLKREERRKQKGSNRREMDDLWQQMDRGELEERMETSYSQKSRNNNNKQNNNNNNKQNSSSSSRERHQPALCQQQQEYSYPLSPHALAPPLGPVLPSAPVLNTLSAPHLAPLLNTLSTPHPAPLLNPHPAPLPRRGCHPYLGPLPQQPAPPTQPYVKHGGGVSTVSGRDLDDLCWKCRHPVCAQDRPPVRVIPM